MRALHGIRASQYFLNHAEVFGSKSWANREDCFSQAMHETVGSSSPGSENLSSYRARVTKRLGFRGIIVHQLREPPLACSAVGSEAYG
jgi:argininosuccinate lyase